MKVKRDIRKAPVGMPVIVLADDKDAAMDLIAFAATTERKLEIIEIGKFKLTK